MRKLRVKFFVRSLLSLIGKFALLLSTFTVGITVTLIWWKFSPPTVTLCRLTQNPDLYRSRTVRVEAEATGGYGLVFISDETCKLPDAAAGVWLEDRSLLDAALQKLFSESATEDYKARIIVTGRFDPEATRGCFTPKAAIHAANIELKSEITTGLRETPKKAVSRQDIAAAKFFADFQKAVAGNNKKLVSSMMQYPLRVNFYTDPRAKDYRFIESRADLLKVYEQVFSPSVKAYIANFDPAEVWGSDYFMQTGSGQIGIAVACKDNEESCDYDFKIKIIHSNSIEIDYQAAFCGDTVDCYLKADDEQTKRQQN